LEEGVLKFFVCAGKFRGWYFFLKNPSKLKKISQKRGVDPKHPFLNTPLMQTLKEYKPEVYVKKDLF